MLGEGSGAYGEGSEGREAGGSLVRGVGPVPSSLGLGLSPTAEVPRSLSLSHIVARSFLRLREVAFVRGPVCGFSLTRTQAWVCVRAVLTAFVMISYTLMCFW